MHSDKSVLITGASSGIGAALAKLFAADGYHIVMTARNKAKMAMIAEDLRRKHKANVTVIGADLGSPNGLSELFNALKDRGIEVHTLVNNAGLCNFGLFKDSDLSLELAMVQVNVKAPVALTRLLLPNIVALNGRILNVASAASFQPGPYSAVYSATKAFVLSFSEALAAELEGFGVTVTALCPGPTATDMHKRASMEYSALVYGRSLSSAESVAVAGYRAMLRGQRVCVPGFVNWLRAGSVRFMPRRVAASAAKFVCRPVRGAQG